MSLTKAEYRTLTQQWLDDPSAKFWTAANLDLLIQVTQDSLWTDILEKNPYYVSQLDTLTSITTPGYIDLASGGDATKRFLRLQSITRNNQEYSQIDRRNITLQGSKLRASNTGSSYTYVFLGDQIHLFPYNLTDDVEFRYSFYPTLFDGLADGTAVQWPEGHEDALILTAAARAMAKGSREDVTQLAALADNAVQAMLEVVERRTPGPKTPYLSGSPISWGSD